MSVGILTYKEALAELETLMEHSEILTKAELEQLVKRISVVDPIAGSNATTYLYSGRVCDGLSTNDLAKAIGESDGSMARVIDRTPAADFLSDGRYEAAVEAVFKNENPELALPENQSLLKKDVGDYMYDPQNGPWANRSAEFVETAHGNVECIIPDAKSGRVWWETEFPNVMNNPNVKSINGIPKEDLLSTKEYFIKELGFSEEKALNGLRETIIYKSSQDMSLIDIFKGEDGILGADTSKLIGGSRITPPEGTLETRTVSEMMGSLSEAELNAKYPLLNELSQKIGSTDPKVLSETNSIVKTIDQTMGQSSESGLKATYSVLSEAAESVRTAQYLKARGITFKALGAVGALLIAVDCVNMIGEADKAYKAGDTEAGNKIVRDWTLETAGGFATAAAFAEAVAPFALALGTCGGPLGIAGGILLELGAGVVGWMVGSELGHAVSDFIGWLFGEAEGASPPRIDPIIFDLDGDGVETLSVQNGVHFDLDNNGFSEKSGWVGSDDGLLVFDRDGNGTIDAGKELFGDQTILKNGSIAANGFQALAEFDENNDGKIDSGDSGYTQLKVWRDLNQDGQSSERELFGLEELGIKSVSLASSSVNTQDSNGNVMRRIGEYEKTDGTVGSLAEFLLSRDTADAVAQKTDEVDIAEDISALPDIDGMGNVYSLRQAMAKDSSKELKALVESFAAEKDAEKRAALLDKILLKWTGADEIEPASRGSNFDAGKLAVIERFTGRPFSGTSGANPIAQAVPFLTQAYGDREYFNSFNLKNPVTNEILNSRRWVIDRERNAVLIGLGGQGIYGCEIPMFYALIWNENIIMLETFSKAIGNNAIDTDFYWKITRIEAPECFLKDNTEMMDMIKEALTAYATRSKNDSVTKVNFDYIASPWFIREVNK